VTAVLDALKHHAACAFDLAVAAWVHDRGIINVNEVVLAEVPKIL
jgi:hypothetical protein